MKSRYFMLVAFVLITLTVSCNKEEPMPVSAEFTTNIQNETLVAGVGFTVYTDRTEGEFLTYFKGDKEETTYGTGYGKVFQTGTDSLVIPAYSTPGTYTFTIVARSYGNWGSVISEDVNSMAINVVAGK